MAAGGLWEVFTTGGGPGLHVIGRIDSGRCADRFFEFQAGLDESGRAVFRLFGRSALSVEFPMRVSHVATTITRQRESPRGRCWR
jgi:hypothetical protein